MNTEEDSGSGNAVAPTPMVRVALVVLTVLLFAEAALMVGVTAWLVMELLVDEPSSLASGLALTAVSAVGATWVVAVAVAAARRAPWARGGAITWQLLQLAVAVGAFQGLFARPDVGWALLAPAITVIVLLLLPPVSACFARPVVGAED
ncbi:hypothetical protein ARHIZOSPH14_02870 [Agromyces rhizosphaerae]|uniref:Uncharacterized protein n=1 Tax=Agromyces rhizosphaerae TaxID=88374 RepID=A0A9W6CUQ9_9MICO|nr:hypothetical protein [Agromyces rhizosphaerae]GLI26045.1 hypothetical protein ARHIZOSPH14_02870 [Agromyces rhizosphaerae]